MVWFMDMDFENGEEMWDNGESVKKSCVLNSAKKGEKKSGCACGRKVCCGKHKNGQCACSKGGRQHD